MRKIFILLLALFGCMQAATAQNHYEGNISIGGQAGATFSRVNFSPSVPQSLQSGIVVGGAFRYVEEKHFGLIAELNVEQRGWKEKFDGYDYAYQRRFTYIQLPVLTHVYFGSDKIHGFFNAGPEIGYMIASSVKSNFDYGNVGSIDGFPSVNRNVDQYRLKVKNHLDYGISAGLGLEWFQSHKQSFRLEGRFYYGLGDVFSNHKTDPFSASNSMMVMVTLGYFYRIK